MLLGDSIDLDSSTPPTSTQAAFAGVKRQPTKREANGGYVSRFLSICRTLGFSRFDGKATLSPTAANVRRWVVECT